MKINVLKIGVVQMKTEIGKYQENIKSAEKMIEECAERKCRLVCLPEAFATTIDFGELSDIAETIPGKTTKILVDFAIKYNLDIIAGILETDKGKIYSSVVYIDSAGRLKNVYRRVNIYDLEKKFFASGNQLAIVKTKWGKVGLLGGYDINFPEMCRRYFEEKTELIVCACQIPDTFQKSTVTIAKARASENNCYFVLASSIGKNSLARIDFMGNSIIAQGGDTFDFASGEYIQQEEILAKAEQEETILTAELDMGKKSMEISENPHMSDRKENYEILEVQYAE